MCHFCLKLSRKWHCKVIFHLEKERHRSAQSHRENKGKGTGLYPQLHTWNIHHVNASVSFIQCTCAPWLMKLSALHLPALWALGSEAGGIRFSEILKGTICILGPVHILRLLCKQVLYTMLTFVKFYSKMLYYVLSFWMYLKLFDLKISLGWEYDTACQKHKGK